MAMDAALTPWVPTSTVETAPERASNSTGSWSGAAIVALRTTVLLVLAAVAILELLPAALAAQVALLG